MSDAGEGLVDAEARLQEQMDAREHERRRRTAGAIADPERHRANESLKLMRTDLARQLELTTHAVRRDSINAAMSEIDRKLSAV